MAHTTRPFLGLSTTSFVAALLYFAVLFLFPLIYLNLPSTAFYAPNTRYEDSFRETKQQLESGIANAIAARINDVAT
jgi:hypothetical protein